MVESARFKVARCSKNVLPRLAVPVGAGVGTGFSKHGLPDSRARRHVFAIVSLFLVAACAHCGTNEDEKPAVNRSVVGSQSERSLRVAWTSTCGDDSERPLFSLDVGKDGSVRFTGADETREKGEVREVIPTKAARKILRAANRAAHAEKLRGLAMDDPGTAYCLRLTLGLNEKIEIPVNTEAIHRGGVELEVAIRRETPLLHWLCPMRIDALFDKGYCAPEEVRLVLINQPDCGYAHTVNLYPKGIVHYFVTPLPMSDVYLTTQEGNIDRLKKLAAGFKEELVVSSSSQGSAKSEFGASRYRVYIGSADIEIFALELQRLTALNWRAPLPARVCPKDLTEFPHGTISIRQ